MEAERTEAGRRPPRTPAEAARWKQLGTGEKDFANLPAAARPAKYQLHGELGIVSDWLYSNILSALTGTRGPKPSGKPRRKSLGVALQPDVRDRLREYLLKMQSYRMGNGRMGRRMGAGEYIDALLFFRNNVLFAAAENSNRRPEEREGLKAAATETVEVAALQSLRRHLGGTIPFDSDGNPLEGIPPTLNAIALAQEKGLIGNQLQTASAKDLYRAVTGEATIIEAAKRRYIPPAAIGILLDAVRRENGLSSVELVNWLEHARQMSLAQLAADLGVRRYETVPKEVEQRKPEELEQYRQLRDYYADAGQSQARVQLRKAQLQVVLDEVNRARQAGRITSLDAAFLQQYLPGNFGRGRITVQSLLNGISYIVQERGRHVEPNLETLKGILDGSINPNRD
ncbi:MAG: hypothetical protein HY394_06565 [Candidatus Diapherotrites archaeon]|nr:hypothetical protein [Candidatus Diapherotrites archaeon]